MNAAPGAGCALELSPHDTLQGAITKLVRVFASAGLETPEIDGRRLVQGVLALQPETVIAEPERILAAHAGSLRAAALRRLEREPISRILGTRMFYGRAFEITPDVLDPRADTETIIEAALDLVERKGKRNQPVAIIDIGTGSGAILVTLLAELPSARGVATDISCEALAVALRNAERHGVLDRMTALHTRSLEGVGFTPDVIVSNPPYVPTGEISGLEAEVRLYDPHVALDGGPDGLGIYREIVRNISELKAPVDVVLEVGAGQAAQVAALLQSLIVPERRASVAMRRDLAGHVRCVTLETEN